MSNLVKMCNQMKTISDFDDLPTVFTILKINVYVIPTFTQKCMSKKIQI